MLGLRPVSEPKIRLPRLLLGLVLFGCGIALMVASDLGLPPWGVLDQGLSERSGIPIGTTGILVGAVLLLAWIPLRERPGWGTVLNVLIIGVVTDLVLLVLDTPDALAMRITYLALGVFLFGPGSGLYIGAGMGPGPRDGLMTGLARRGVGSIRAVRTGLELTVLVVGWLLGGTVGVGTVAFAVTVGPNLQFFLTRLSIDRPTAQASPVQPIPQPEAA